LAGGKEIFAYTLGKPVTAGPAIAENTILVGCEDGAVYAFRPAQPAISP
jgi:outer membrane protein assembly factor BamB